MCWFVFQPAKQKRHFDKLSEPLVFWRRMLWNEINGFCLWREEFWLLHAAALSRQGRQTNAISCQTSAQSWPTQPQSWRTAPANRASHFVQCKKDFFIFVLIQCTLKHTWCAQEGGCLIGSVIWIRLWRCFTKDSTDTQSCQSRGTSLTASGVFFFLWGAAC